MDNVPVFSLAPDVIAEAWRLQEKGVNAVNAGRPGVGIAALKDGLRIVQWNGESVYDGDGPARRVTARLLISMAAAESDLGAPGRGLTLLKVAEEYVAEEHRGVLLNQRGLIQWRSGDYPEALRCMQEAEPLLRAYGPVHILALVLQNRGSLYTELGRYELARTDLGESTKIAELHGLHLFSAMTLHTRGILERSAGDVPSALSLLSRAGELYTEHAPGRAPDLAISTADALRQAGLLHDAAARLDDAMAALEEQGRELDLVVSEVHRAWVALEAGDIQAAVRFAAGAEKRAHRQGNTALADWPARVRREAEFRLGSVTPRFAAETLEIAERRRTAQQEDTADFAEILAARAFVSCGRPERADPILHKRPRAAGDHVLATRLARQLGRAELAVAQGDPSRALRELRTGLDVLHKRRQTMGSLELQAGAATLGSELASQGLGLSLDSKRATTIFSWSERSRAQAYRLPAVHPPQNPETAELLAEIRSLHGSLRDAEQTGQSNKDDLVRLRRAEKRFQELDLQVPGPGDSIPELRPAQVRAELEAADHTLVSFLKHDGQLHALTVTGKNIRHHRLGPAKPVEELTRRLLADLEALTGRRLPARMADVVRSSVRHHCEELSKVLFGGIRSRIGDADLVVVGTGALTSLPWGMLPPLAGRPVTVAPSAAVWWDARRRAATGPGTPLLASGPDLRFAESEIDTIAESYPRSTVLQGNSATPEAIQSGLDGAPIAHLAAHGHHEPDNVLFSRMEFAAGSLMAYDIARLTTPPAHVTLSACDVGQSTVAIGDETLGFTAALLYAGTRTVVSSVAKVEHEEAAQIMTAYHRGLVDGLDPARALADASAGHALSPFVCYGAG